MRWAHSYDFQTLTYNVLFLTFKVFNFFQVVNVMLWIDVKTHGIKCTKGNKEKKKKEKEDRQKSSFCTHIGVICVSQLQPELLRARSWDDPTTVCPLHRRQQLSHPGALAASTRTTFETPFTAVGYTSSVTQSHHHTLHRCVCSTSTFAAKFVRCTHACESVCAWVWESFWLEHIERALLTVHFSWTKQR